MIQGKRVGWFKEEVGMIQGRGWDDDSREEVGMTQGKRLG